jgi:hypothetical protein
MQTVLWAEGFRWLRNTVTYVGGLSRNHQGFTYYRDAIRAPQSYCLARLTDKYASLCVIILECSTLPLANNFISTNLSDEELNSNLRLAFYRLRAVDSILVSV